MKHPPQGHIFNRSNLAPLPVSVTMEDDASSGTGTNSNTHSPSSHTIHHGTSQHGPPNTNNANDNTMSVDRIVDMNVDNDNSIGISNSNDIDMNYTTSEDHGDVGGQAVRLLQVTLPGVDHGDENEVIGGGIGGIGNNTNLNTALSSTIDASTRKRTRTASEGEFCLQSPAPSTATPHTTSSYTTATTNLTTTTTSNTETNNDRNLELKIERGCQQLSDVDRQQLDFDMRSNQYSSTNASSSVDSTTGTSAATTSASASTGAVGDAHAPLPPLPPVVDAADLAAKTKALGRELTRLLEDPLEQLANPLYKPIAQALRNSGTVGVDGNGTGNGNGNVDSNDANNNNSDSSDSGNDLFYANSVNFRTKLLRAEHYNVDRAAKRTAGYLTLLWESFGKELLGRPILLSDLSPSERQLQRKGYQQIFRFRDQPMQQQQQNQQQTGGSGSSGTGGNDSPGGNRLQQQYQQQHGIDTEAGRRIAGSFDLCRCTSTSEPSIDNETSKVRIRIVLICMYVCMYVCGGANIFQLLYSLFARLALHCHFISLYFHFM